MTTEDDERPDRASGEDGSFLSRWSRRKAEVRREQQRSVDTAAEAEASRGGAPADTAASPEPEIDPATLPPIESLNEESDFSVFLKKGVPQELRAAALRKLWLVEPSVKNYQALVEYNWDFTAPGYGALLPTDDVAKLAQRVISGFSQDPKDDTPPAQPTNSPPETEVPSSKLQHLDNLPHGNQTEDNMVAVRPSIGGAAASDTSADPSNADSMADERTNTDGDGRRGDTASRVGGASGSDTPKRRRHGGALPA